MNVFNRFIRFLDAVTDIIIRIFFICFFLMGLYAVYDSYMLYASASDDSILRFKPGYESGDDTVQKEISEDMVAWVSVDDTTIDYPVMQGKDNSEYLNKNVYGEYSLSGSVFLDSRNSSDFLDYYNLIYGHHMERGLMFGALDDYLKEGFLETHRTGSITVDDIKYPIIFFAVIEADATNDAIFAPTENDDETLPYVLEHSLYLSYDDIPKKNEQIIALSTCKFPNTAERTIIFGMIQSPVT